MTARARPPVAARRPDQTVRFGVLGARSFVATAAVLPAIDAAHNAELVAAASRSGPVQAPWDGVAVADYDDILADPAVDAVYLPLPNGLHVEWIERAAAAGKHVLCEKPLAPDAAAAARAVAACAAAGVVLGEAWMTPHGAHWATIGDVIDSGAIGDLRSIDAAFRFTIGAEHDDNYRWDHAHGGGALLDVGIYTLGVAVERWGPAPDEVVVPRRVRRWSVDARTDAVLRWGDRTATISCSFVDPEEQRLTITGSAGDRTFGAELDGGVFTGGDPYRPMVEAFADAVRGGAAEWPRSPQRSIEMLTLLERIAHTPADVEETLP